MAWLRVLADADCRMGCDGMRHYGHSKVRLGPRRAFLALALVALLALVAAGRAEPRGPLPTGYPIFNHAGDEIFTNLSVLKLRIEISSTGMDILRGTARVSRYYQPDRRPSAKCTVYEGGKVYREVEVHLKGAAGSFRSVDDDPALTLDFDKYVKGQTFHGLKKISLNNSVQDGTYLCERLCREMFIEAGMPAPRAGFATLELNGRFLGMRVLLETYDRQFLRRYFKDVSGNLYDAGFATDLNLAFKVNAGDKPEDRADLKQLLLAATQSRTKGLAALEQILDVDYFLNLVAMEVLQCHWDGYTMNRNNYRIFHDRERGRLLFMPHGMDQTFGVKRASPDLPITPQLSGMLARTVLDNREGMTRYLNVLTNLAAKHFDVERLTNRVAELANVVRAAIAEREPNAVTYYNQEARWLSRRIVERGASLKKQIADLERLVRFAPDGTAKLAGWKPKQDQGALTFAERTEGGQLSLLEVTGQGVGGYRTRIMLLPGRYRVEGRMKLEKVETDANDSRAGAGFRVGWSASSRKLTGTTDWVDFKHGFEVYEEISELDVLCEYRAKAGKATFDAGSIRLVAE